MAEKGKRRNWYSDREKYHKKLALDSEILYKACTYTHTHTHTHTHPKPRMSLIQSEVLKHIDAPDCI